MWVERIVRSSLHDGQLRIVCTVVDSGPHKHCTTLHWPLSYLILTNSPQMSYKSGLLIENISKLITDTDKVVLLNW